MFSFPFVKKWFWIFPLFLIFKYINILVNRNNTSPSIYLLLIFNLYADNIIYLWTNIFFFLSLFSEDWIKGILVTPQFFWKEISKLSSFILHFQPNHMTKCVPKVTGIVHNSCFPGDESLKLLTKHFSALRSG